MGIYFYPRGGSAHVSRALAREFERDGFEVTRALRIALGPRRARAGARASTPGSTCGPVDFTPALRERRPAPLRRRGRDRRRCTAPTRTGPAPRTRSWPASTTTPTSARSRPGHGSCDLAGAAEADLLYLHHLTPINEAAARAFPELPVLGHVHGTELLMLERIAAAPPPELDPRRELGRAALRVGGGLRADRRQQPEQGMERRRRPRARPGALRLRSPTASTPTFAPARDRPRAPTGAATWSRAPGLAAGLGRRAASPTRRPTWRRSTGPS